jgi:hypothetical protein
MKLNTELLVGKFTQPKYITIVCFIISYIVFLITYINPIAHGDNILYFISSISQGLAAIFTLIFTITLFGTQMMKRYTSMSKILDKWTIFLMILFAIGIILPLIQLIVNCNYLPFEKIANLSLSIDLFLATFCVLSIIPYSIRINQIIKYESGISNLIEEASEAIDSNHKITASNKMSELIELGNGSVFDMKWDHSFIILEKLELLGKEIIDKNWIDLSLDTINGMKKIGMESSHKEIKVTVKAIMGLTSIGIKSVDKKLDGVPCYLGKSVNDSFGLLQYIDYDGIYDNLDYDSVCSILGIDSPKLSLIGIMNFIGLNNGDIAMSRFILQPENTKSSNHFPFFLTETYNNIKNEQHLNLIEHFGIGRYYSLPQETMEVLAEIGVSASNEIASIKNENQYSQKIQIVISALNGLKIMGINAIDNDLSDCTVSMASYCMYRIGKVCVTYGPDFTDRGDDAVNEINKMYILFHNVISSLKTIANKAYLKDKNRFQNSYESSLGFLWILGAYSNRYLPNYAKEMASNLKKSNDLVCKDIFGSEEIRKEVREYLKNSSKYMEEPGVFEELKAFEEIFDKY